MSKAMPSLPAPNHSNSLRRMDEMDEDEPTIFVVDDDESVRDALDGLFRALA